jgi:hypothetical protein
MTSPGSYSFFQLKNKNKGRSDRQEIGVVIADGLWPRRLASVGDAHPTYSACTGAICASEVTRLITGPRRPRFIGN